MKNITLGLTLVLLLAASLHQAQASSPQYVPGYPLYCQGPLTTGTVTAAETSTSFKWAPTGAGAHSPAAGHCAWADRAAGGPEIQAGGGNIVCDFSGAMKSVPAGEYVEVGVARDPLVHNCMHLVRYIGKVSPPFSAVPHLQPFVRQSIAALSAAQVASLRKGIQVMMSRPSSDPTSFAFQANIHGTYTAASTPEETLSWNNCEHGSYYFLSWHRMYLYFFDRILRAAAKDPELVLPYWNWTDSAQRTLPLPFRQPAAASNPLYIAAPGRPQALNDGTANLGAGTVAYSGAFADTHFDSPTGSGASFGGQIASPTQFNNPHGEFESQPHDVVHVALGGLMTDPDTAAEDPIFWLHHANIDRMWNRWIAQGGGRSDAADAAWRNTQFTFYDEAGHAVYLTGSEIEETVSELNYRYDDDLVIRFPVWPLPITLRGPLLEEEAQRSSAPPEPDSGVRKEEAAETPLRALADNGAAAEARRIGLAGETARIAISLSDTAILRLRELITHEVPHQVYLRLDDIQYEKSSGVYYEVYLNPPADKNLDIHSPGYVGNLALFGLKHHATHAGHAQTPGEIFVDYDISHLVRAALAQSEKTLNVVLVPRGLFDAKGNPLPVASNTQGSVGRIQILSR
jgi:hypothetical protein